MVEATGLEPAASWSQTKHSTKLSYASIINLFLTIAIEEIDKENGVTKMIL